MALQDIQVGYLFSSTGSYELVARSMLNGALLATPQASAFALSPSSSIPAAIFRNTPRSQLG
jgi:hypothetical protein